MNLESSSSNIHRFYHRHHPQRCISLSLPNNTALHWTLVDLCMVFTLRTCCHVVYKVTTHHPNHYRNQTRESRERKEIESGEQRPVDLLPLLLLFHHPQSQSLCHCPTHTTHPDSSRIHPLATCREKDRRNYSGFKGDNCHFKFSPFPPSVPPISEPHTIGHRVVQLHCNCPRLHWLLRLKWRNGKLLRWPERKLFHCFLFSVQVQVCRLGFHSTTELLQLSWITIT